jgi:hypothetical protein
MSEFNYIDTVRLGINAANALDTPMHKSAIAEFGRMLSSEVTAGEWSQDGDTMLNSAGQNVEEYLIHLIRSAPGRPHWLIPATVVQKTDTTWTSGSLAEQGKRWKELRAFLGNDAATDAAMKAEATLYGAKVGSTVKGHKPGSKRADETRVGASNPYSSEYAKRHGLDAARTEQGRLILALGIKGATALAAAAGCFVSGAKKPS